MNIGIGFVSKAAAWNLPRHHVDRLRHEFPQHTFLEAWDRSALRGVLQRSDAALAAVIERTLVASLERLRWVQAPAAGVGHVLSTELAASPIVVTSARGIRTHAIAEHVMMVTLALARQLRRSLERQREHVWALDELESAGTIRTLHGKRMGLVGLGSVGTEVAALASAFGMRVSASRRRVDAPVPSTVERVVPPDRLAELLAESDVIVLAATLSPLTERLIGKATLASVKRGAILVNVGRGRLIDDDAVIDALADGRLAGAALDVFTREPLERSSPFWDLPNVIVTPHVAGAMEDYWTPLVGLFAENLRRFERGEPLLNVVDKATGY